MSRLIPGSHNHLSLQDRQYIEMELNKGTSFKDIARFLCRDPATISKEVRLHRFSDWYHKGSFVNKKNFCVKRFTCRKTNAFGKLLLCDVKCSGCPACSLCCPDFVKEHCGRLDKAPYVCNGCDKLISRCTIAQKYRYDALFADRKYRESLSSSREGINLTKQELRDKDAVITPLVLNGQSPCQIVANHPELELSVRTLYSYISKGMSSWSLTSWKSGWKLSCSTPFSP